MISKDSCFHFPCSFPVKVMGRNSEAFSSVVKDIFQKHVAPEPIAYFQTLSRSGAYLSITATFIAHNKEQLDALYEELNAHKLVLMTL